MKPNNSTTEGCTQTSSNCVTYQGVDIPCIGIKKGDCLTEDLHKIACRICEILKELNVSTYDLSCLNLETCAPPNFSALLQLIIDKICALQNIPSNNSTTKNGCPDCVVNIASCFYFADPKTGNQVTTLQLTDYITLIGNQLCTLITAAATQQAALSNHGQRIAALENKPAPVFNLPLITPVCVLPAKPTALDLVVVALEKQFCELVSATGTTTALYKAISQQPAGLNTSPALGTQGGVMSAIPGWASDPKNAADTINNIWLTIQDIRSAVSNIQANCCPTPCNGVSVKLQAAMPNPNVINLFFTGTIPEGLSECSGSGTMFKISDQSGHYINVSIPLAANMNNPSGYPVQLVGTPININDDLKIEADICFKNDTGTVCQSKLCYTFVNTANCPLVNYIAGQNTINYSFPANFTATYAIDLFDSTGTVELQSAAVAVSAPVVLNGVFSGLDPGTVYKLRLRIISEVKTTVCPFTSVTTVPNPCSPPNTLTVYITVP
jgi:hypothetical protein